MPAPATPATPGYHRHTAPRAALRELLEATLEWSGLSGPARGLTVEGVRFRLTPLTGGVGGVAVLCEAQVGVPIPEYPARRRMRRQMAGGSAPNLVIFTDAAHSALVWSWLARGDSGERVYRELSFRPGETWGPLRPALESIGSGTARWSATAPLGDRERARGGRRARLTAALASRIEAAPGADLQEYAQAVQDSIEEAETPEGVRDCWAALLATRVTDSPCGSGEWLEAAVGALIPAYEACLERMLSSLDDLRRRLPPPRMDKLGDFARLVARAGGRSHPDARRRFATELALLRNTFGADPDPSAAAAARARLVGLLPDSDEGLGPDLLALNIRAASAAAPAREVPPADHEGDQGGAPGVVRRAVATILRMHLDGAVSLSELSRAMAAAAERLGDTNPFDPAGPAAARPAGKGGLRLVRRSSAIGG